MQSPWAERAEAVPKAQDGEPIFIEPIRPYRGIAVSVGLFAIQLVLLLAAGELLVFIGGLETEGLEYSLRGQQSHAYVTIGVILISSILGGCIAADPNFERRTEMVFTMLGLTVVCVISWMNMMLNDTLIPWRTQIGIDAVQVIFAIATLPFLAAWDPRLELMKGVRFLASYVISAFALALPLLYLSIAVLKLLGADWFSDGSADDHIKLISALLGLPIAAASLFYPEHLRRSGRPER